MTLGETIQYYRKRAGLSQEALAELVGVSRQSVSKWELDDAVPEIGKLKALAGAFGITVDQLLSGEVPPQPGETAQEQPDGPQASPAQGGDSFDRATGFLGKLIRRYGWLAGVYTAVSGAGVALLGGIARFAFSAMGNTAQNMMNSMGPLGGGSWEVSGDSFDVPPEILEQMGIQPSPAAQMTSVPVAVATVILVVGVLIAIAGVVMAVVLYQKGHKK